MVRSSSPLTIPLFLELYQPVVPCVHYGHCTAISTALCRSKNVARNRTTWFSIRWHLRFSLSIDQGALSRLFKSKSLQRTFCVTRLRFKLLIVFTMFRECISHHDGVYLQKVETNSISPSNRFSKSDEVLTINALQYYAASFLTASFASYVQIQISVYHTPLEHTQPDDDGHPIKQPG